MSDKTDIVIELNQEWRASHTPDARFLTVHVAEWIRCTDLTRRAAEEIKRLRQERDEARRRACRDEALIRLERGRVHRDSEEAVRMAKEISVERGWDCFKENS